MLPCLVRDLMSQGVTTLHLNERLDLAHQIMNLTRIRHMPVLNDEGRLVGVITQRDLFHSALVKAMGVDTAEKLQILSGLAVEDVMVRELVSTQADTPLIEAARLMRERGVGCLPVLEGDTLVGILTEADFVKFFAEQDLVSEG